MKKFVDLHLTEMMLWILHFIFALIYAPVLVVIEWFSGSWRSKAATDDRYRPCSSSSPYPYCDASLSKNDRINYLINTLKTTEKISLLGHESPEIKRRGVYLPAYKWWNEGLHGMAWTGKSLRAY